MNVQDLNKIRNKVKENRPLIHCITNPISINSCANAILAVGARPVMAEHPREVAEIAATAQALLFNLGNITDVRMESMSIAARTAKAHNIPFVLDLVGVACSALRREFAHKLMKIATPAVIKGNYSEILAFCRDGYRSSGVDADKNLDASAVTEAAAELAKKYKTTVLASGKTDIVTDGRQAVFVQNGTPRLGEITGTGCMLGALCACYLSQGERVTAAACACGVLGICGEAASAACGNGSFATALMDALSTVDDKALEANLKMEVREIETV